MSLGHFSALLLLVIPNISKAQGLLNDDFNGSLVDSSKWDLISPYAYSSAFVSNGNLISVNHGTIISKQTFSGLLDISGNFNLISSFSAFNVWLRTEGVVVPSAPFKVYSGINVGFLQNDTTGYSGSSASQIYVGEWHGDGFNKTLIRHYSTPLALNSFENFRIVDTGSQISVEINGSQLFSVTTVFSSGSKIAFSGRERLFSYGLPDNQTDMGQIQIVPEPSSLSLLIAGGAVLMAGRRRK